MDPFLNLNLNLSLAPSPQQQQQPVVASPTLTASASVVSSTNASASTLSSSAPSLPLTAATSSASSPSSSAPGLEVGLASGIGNSALTLAAIDFDPRPPSHQQQQGGHSGVDPAASSAHADIQQQHQQQHHLQGVAKRPRTVQACLPCRQRKVRCTGEFPCIRCAKRNIECVYAQPMAHHQHLHHPYQQLSQQQHSSARHQQHQPTPQAAAAAAPSPSSPTHLALQQIAHLQLADSDSSNTGINALLGSPAFDPTSPPPTLNIINNNNNNNTSNDLNNHPQRSILHQQFQYQLQLQHEQQQQQNQLLPQIQQIQNQHHQYMQHCLSSVTQPPPPTVTVSVNNLGQLVGLSSLGLSSAVHVHRDWSRPLSDGHLMLHPFSDPTLMLQSNSFSSSPASAATLSSTTVPLSSTMFARELESFLPSHHIAPIFLDAFFNHVAPWIPAASNVNNSNASLIPRDLLHQVYARPDVSNVGLLYAAMCLGAHSLERSRQITIQNEPRPLSRMYFERARHILSPALTGQAHSIVTVQAFMLLAYYALNLPGTAASTLCQLALQMVADMGINHAHFPFKNLADISNHTPYDKDHTDQLLATLYSLHVSLALARGQVIHFPTPAPFLALCHRDLDANADGYPIWSLRLSNLTSAAIRAHFHFSDDLRTHLAAFRDQLPAHMRFQRPSSTAPTNPTQFAQSALLNLRYYTLVLLLAQNSRATHNTDTISRTIAAVSHILQAIRDHLAHFPFPLVHECTVMLGACARVANVGGTSLSSASSASSSSSTGGTGSSASGSPAPPTAAIVGDDAENDQSGAGATGAGVDVSMHLDAIVDLVYASMALWPEMATLAFTAHGLEKALAARGSAGHGRGSSDASGGGEQEQEESDIDDEILRDPWRVISAFNESSERVMEAVELWAAGQQKEVVAKVLEKYLPQA